MENSYCNVKEKGKKEKKDEISGFEEQRKKR
jgi:hypothetical protein